MVQYWSWDWLWGIFLMLTSRDLTVYGTVFFKLKSMATISATARWMSVKWDVCSAVCQSTELSANIFAQTQGCSNIWTKHQYCHFWPHTVCAELFGPEWNIPAESLGWIHCVLLMLTKQLNCNWDLTTWTLANINMLPVAKQAVYIKCTCKRAGTLCYFDSPVFTTDDKLCKIRRKMYEMLETKTKYVA